MTSLREWPDRLGKRLLEWSDRLGNKFAGRPEPLVLGLVVLAAAGTALGQLGRLMTGMHVPGDIASSLQAALTRGPGHLHEAIHAWSAWWLTVKDLRLASPRSAIELSLVLNVAVFIPAYAVVLMVAVHGLRRIAGEENEQGQGRQEQAGSDAEHES